MQLNPRQIQAAYIIAIAFCFMPMLSPAFALIMGIAFSLAGLKSKVFSQHTSLSLKASIVLMGFGMNLTQVVNTSQSAFFETAISVITVMLAGYFLTRLFKIEAKTGLLISAGTAICGGSAIAAISNVLNARNHQVSFSLIVVFILNAIALLVFPSIGHYFNLSQETFGHWAAIAIHDTSSVVGAGASYGKEALEIATTVKLIRALWIIPLAIIIAITQKNNDKKAFKFPFFIVLFVVAIIIAHFLPQYQEGFAHIKWLGKRGMVVALFLIGSEMSIKEAKKAGVKSFVFGILLWAIIGGSSLLYLTSTN
ncbi:YeiH family protein [Plebeiibacterium marinum]|uniref:Sulfate exporter family transporter n=1 Tax=Plebeiibacterium marinum TaxID=2992111 RepID=A0AAE3MCV2_9BACT|nr:putative sulfate exporter family transporter [Plebeiobacterium marinum]MCW3805416.1 putative sulfate exporter family transporter [Plebeiobacterium marinum]